MPTFVKGNMWDIFGKTDLFLVTTNPIVRKDGACVMGRGIAKQAADFFPEIPFRLGTIIKSMWNEVDWEGTGSIGTFDGQEIGYFMVKSHWAQPAEQTIITDSAHSLLYTYDDNPRYKRIDLNFPGIGNGKLKREDVLPLLEILPANVHIWEFE